MSAARAFTVVENAGYVGERDVRSFPDYAAASAFMASQYDDEDRERLRPDIRQDWTDADGTEHSEYVC